MANSSNAQNTRNNAIQACTSIQPLTGQGFTAQESSDIAKRLNQRLGPEYIAQRAGPGGRKVPYITGDKCINLANQIFGFNGWSSSVQNIQTDFVDESAGRVSLGLSAIVRVTLRDGTYHEDIGYGEAENIKGKAAAFTKAKKSAITDGRKRALRNFGEAFNCVSDPDFVKRILRIKAPQRVFDETLLLRHPDHVRSTILGTSTSTRTDQKVALLHTEQVSSEHNQTSEDFGDLDDICIEDEEYDGFVDDESLLNLIPTPSKAAKEASGLPSVASNSNGPPLVVKKAEAQQPDTVRILTNSTKDGKGPWDQLKNGLTTTTVLENGTNKNIKDLEEHAQVTTFFSAKAALLDARPSEGTIFDPYRQSPSIPRSIGIDHSKSSPVTRNSVPTAIDSVRAQNLLGRGSITGQIPTTTKSGTHTSVSNNRGFRTPSMTNVQNPGQIPYPPLPIKRSADGSPANNSPNPSSRMAFGDVSKTQLNAQTLHNISIKHDPSVNEQRMMDNITKRTRT